MTLTFEGFEINPIHEGDAWKICDFVVSNTDELKRYFPKTREQNLNPTLSQIYVENSVKAFEKKERFVFTLKHSETRQLIGLIILKNLDWKSKQGELAYAIDYNFYGQGLMSKAIKVLSNYVCHNLDLQTLQILVHQDNIPSVKVAQNSGFVWQKTLKESFTPINENAVDMELYELYNT